MNVEIHEAENSDTPLAYRAARSGLWVALSSYFNIAFGFGANILLTRLLNPADFGVFALAFFFYSIGNLRPKAGLTYAFAQRKTATGALLGTHFRLELGTATATLLLALAAAPLLLLMGYSSGVAGVLPALAAIGILDGLTATAWGMLDRELRMGATSLISSLVFPISYLPAFYLAFNGGGYWSLVAQNGTYALLLSIGIWITARRQLPKMWQIHWSFDRQMARELLRFGMIAGLPTIAATLVGQFDNYLVGTYVSENTLGFYDRAYRIANWPNLLVAGVLTRATFYTYTRLQDDPVRLRKTATMAIWLVSSLALPIALGIFAAAPDLVVLLWQDRYLPSAVFLRFLVIYSLIRPLLDNANLLFVATGRPRWATNAAFGHAFALILFATPLTFAFRSYATSQGGGENIGAVGTSIGVGLAFITGLVINYHYLRKIVDLNVRQSILAPVLAAMGSLVAVFLLIQLAPIDNLQLWASVLVKGGGTVLVFFGLMLLFQGRLILERTQYVMRLVRGRGGENQGL